MIQTLDKTKRFICWSGGKDSTASICKCYELGIRVDGVVITEVMFDLKRNISGENPKHIKWVYDVAIPIIKNVFGYEVIILRDKSDYIQEFNHRVGKKSKIPSRIGKKRGWFIGGMCIGNDRLKMRPLRKFFKSIGKCETIVGIAADEPKRYNKKTMQEAGKRSILFELGITESMTYDICRKYNLLSPIYESVSRGGCWFCPNQAIAEFAALKKEYPELWAELKLLSQDKEIVSQGFKYGKTFQEVEKEVDLINNQMTIFDILEDKND